MYLLFLTHSVKSPSVLIYTINDNTQQEGYKNI